MVFFYLSRFLIYLYKMKKPLTKYKALKRLKRIQNIRKIKNRIRKANNNIGLIYL